MPASTDNRIVVRAPFDAVWEMTNDVADWPNLFSEYAAAEVLSTEGGAVRFRLTTVPDPDGRAWSWVSERVPDRENRRVTARRVEPGPFEFMRLRWDYRELPEGVELRWRQEFAVRPDSGFTDEAMRERLDRTTRVQMAHVKSVVEARAGQGART